MNANSSVFLHFWSFMHIGFNANSHICFAVVLWESCHKIGWTVDCWTDPVFYYLMWVAGIIPSLYRFDLCLVGQKSTYVCLLYWYAQHFPMWTFYLQPRTYIWLKTWKDHFNVHKHLLLLVFKRSVGWLWLCLTGFILKLFLHIKSRQTENFSTLDSQIIHHSKIS